MSTREVIVLGTASQVPTRVRNHNALFVRWDDLGLLVDPGEGTQRQLLHAGIAATQITHVLITHFHGDHCLGLAGMIQRISLDRVPHAVEIIYPQSGQEYFDRLRHASIFFDQAILLPHPIGPVEGPGDEIQVTTIKDHTIVARPLDHRVECFGYRLQERDGRTMLPERLAAFGIQGPAVGELQRAGSLTVNGRVVTVEEVSRLRKGQALAVVMDTRPCEGATELAKGADVLVCESTYLSTEQEEADAHHHMTARGAAELAQSQGVRRLVLTHFSQRYTSLDGFRQEASTIHADVVVAEDLCTVAVPRRA